MNYSEFYEYNDIIEKVTNSKKLQQYSQKYNLSQNDIIMYLAYSSMLGTNRTKRCIINMQREEREANKSSTSDLEESKDNIVSKYCTEASKNMLLYIFDEIDFFPNSLNQYNSQFSEFNKFSKYDINPYTISENNFLIF